MKKIYQTPEMEIDYLEDSDIITTSGGVTIEDGNIDDGEGELDD